MAGRIDSVQISCAGGEAYQREAGALAALYGALLGMERYDPGYIKLGTADESHLEVGFESDDGGKERRPRWPDPEHPQQLHLDIEVGDLDAASRVATDHGATHLQDFGDHRVFADNVGHPFCLYHSSALADRPGRIARIVVDCFSPRALAAFYAELLDMPARVHDAPEDVVIAGTDDGPMLAFHHAIFPAPRWPDPAYPPQLHLDLSFDDFDAGVELIERIGGVHLASKPMHAVYADPASHPFCVGTPAPPGWRAEQWAKRRRDG